MLGPILSVEECQQIPSSLSQFMAEKRNASIIKEMAGRKQYMFIKEENLHILKFL